MFSKGIDDFLEGSHCNFAINWPIVAITANRACAFLDHPIPKRTCSWDFRIKSLQVRNGLVDSHERFDESFFFFRLFC